MKNVLVIGGDSFVAKNFINSYSQDYNFTVLSRFVTGFKNEYIVHDFFNLSVDFFKEKDAIINFAAIVHQPKIKDKNLYRKINFKLPLYLAENSLKNDIRHFIQISTIAVYGNADMINESTPYNPTNYYGEFKLKTDLELNKINKPGFKITTIRPSMIYGGGKAPGNMSNLISLIKKTSLLPFKGVDNKRYFLNVKNFVQALAVVIDKKIDNNIILADEEGISTHNLIRLITKLLDIPDRQIKLGLFWKFLKKVKPDLHHKLIGNLIVKNTYNFNNLGLKRIYTIEEGIREMI